MAEKLISVTPSNRPSSTILLQSRIRLRNQGSAGMRSGSGNVSSRYSQMRVDSMIALPSCRSVGTTPFGLSFRYFGIVLLSLKQIDLDGLPIESLCAHRNAHLLTADRIAEIVKREHGLLLAFRLLIVASR